MNEHEMIRSMLENFSKNPSQRNDPFTCDSELIEIGGQLWALTMDEFTPEEDLFTEENPRKLGSNITVATLSDLLAAGAEPAFFMQSVAFSKNKSPEYISEFCSGIQSILDKAGCFLCGGDTGTSSSWRFTGFAMGRVPDNKPVTRIFPVEPQILWVTGSLGGANLAALTKRPTPVFELRTDTARLIRKYASACIDTSGGFLDSIWQLHTLNPDMNITVDCELLPFADGIAEYTATSGIPAETALLGGAGEYELLFATPERLEASIADELTHASATQIGTVLRNEELGIYLCRENQLINKMSVPPPCAREAASVEDHIHEVICMARELFSVKK